jgi:hypothetical protein
MDDQRFDDLTRALASTASRRRVLTGLVGLAGGLFVSVTGSAQNGCPPNQVSRRGSGCVCRTTGRPPENGVCPCPSGQIDCGGRCAECCADADCEDGNLCTTNTCPDGRCRRARVVCPPASNQCLVAQCRPDTGCLETPMADGTPCEDGDPCTLNDTCQAGVCMAGPPRDCSEFDVPCSPSVCDVGTGDCRPAPLPDGTTCGGEVDLCAEPGSCLAGACQPGQPIPCTPSTACHEAHCDPASGDCVEVTLPDETECGAGKFCRGGQCQGPGAVGIGEECDVNGDCATGTCLEGACSDCGLPGDRCGASATCCRGACTSGRCGCKGTSASCADNAECCSGTCGSGACACKETDRTCSSNQECCSGICESGRCACVTQGGSCGGGAGCCTPGYCNDRGICDCRGLYEPTNSRNECCSNKWDGNSICTCELLGQECSESYHCCNGIDVACCDGTCVELDSNLDHCGACGVEAPSGGICSFGEPTCTAGFFNSGGKCCPNGWRNCGGTCRDIRVDLFHCGACNVSVPSGGICSSGTPTCTAGAHISDGHCCPDVIFTDWCEDRCVNKDSDPLHCGRCGRECSGARFICAGGKCCNLIGECD